MSSTANLVVIETHPVQYHAPVYRALQGKYGIPTTAIYASDFSVRGYTDSEFAATFAWDTDLLSGYSSTFLYEVNTFQAGNPPPYISARGLSEKLRQITPGAILLTGYSPRFYQIAAWHAWRGGYPILFRGEATDIGRSRTWLKRLGRDAGLRWLYGQCAGLLYIGQNSREHFRRLGCPDSKLIFSPYCVNEVTFQFDEDQRAILRPRAQQALGLQESQIVILFSGKLSHRKGPDLLLRAIKNLPETIRNKVVVIFLGSGELQAYLDTLAKTSPCVDVRFVGFKNQSGLSLYYHAADLLALPSRHSETWGLVVNEALLHGLPCLVSNQVGSAPDLVKPGITGEIFQANSLEDLGAALTRVLALTERFEVRQQCRAVANEYSTDKAAAGIAQAYMKVFNGRNITLS